MEDQVLKEFAGKSDKLEESRRALLDRATNMEAGVEATLLKVASEQLLSVSELAELGNQVTTSLHPMISISVCGS